MKQQVCIPPWHALWAFKNMDFSESSDLIKFRIWRKSCPAQLPTSAWGNRSSSAARGIRLQERDGRAELCKCWTGIPSCKSGKTVHLLQEENHIYSQNYWEINQEGLFCFLSSGKKKDHFKQAKALRGPTHLKPQRLAWVWAAVKLKPFCFKPLKHRVQQELHSLWVCLQ